MDLQIPSLHTPGQDDFKTDPGTVKQWVAELPLVNTGKSAYLLQDALSGINSIAVPVQQRFATLEQLAAPLRHVTDALMKRFLGKRFPLDGRSLEQATQATALCLEMATGYKIVAAQLAGRQRSDPQLAQAVLKATRYLGEALLGSYLIYVPYPAGIWRDLHSLYALTVRNGLAGRTTNGYKQSLLFSLACPYRMRQNEIRSVHALLGEWAQHCRLYTANDTRASGYFTCHLDSDEPPRYRQEGQDGAVDNHWLVIDTHGLEGPVRATIGKRRQSKARLSTLPDEMTLQRLMLSWGMMPKRQFQRHDSETSVRLVIGLAAVHQALTDPGELQPPPDDTESHEVVDDGQYLRDPTFERITTINTRPVREQQSDNPFMGAYSPGLRPDDDSVRVESWKMHDLSAGGYCLLWDSTEASAARVGELVAMGEGDDNSDLHLGAIRWMRFTPAEGLALGVQMLSPGARPVWASLCREQAGMEDRMHGILLPGIESIDQPATLLLPPLPFHTGCLSTLSEADSDRTIRLTGRIEDTGSFAQFRFAEEVRR